jgi:ABC-type Fe3+ transport system substrate-binding protein
MRKRRWRSLLAVVAAVALTAAACQGEEEQPTEEDGAQDFTGQSLEVAAVWTSPEQERFTMVLDAFAEQTGAEVSFTSTGDDIAAVLGPRIEGGDPPDVAVLPQPGLVQDYVGQDALIPIDDAAGDEIDANFPPGARQVGTVDDTLYAVWFKAAQKSTLWYNVNVLNDAGVQPPTTWEEVQTAAGTISDFGVTPYSVGAADGWTLSDLFENIYLTTAGGDMYDQLTRHEIPWTDESVKTALTRMGEVVTQDDLIAGGVSGALQTDFNTSVTQMFKDPPDGAMTFEGSFVGGIVTGETEAQLGTDADFVTFPSIDGSPPGVVGGGDLAVLMKDTEAGKALIEFLATPEAGEIWGAEGGFISPSPKVDPANFPDDTDRRAAEALVAAGDAVRYDLSDLQPSEFGATSGQGIWGLLQEFMRNGDVDATAEALEDAAAKAFG